MTTPSVDVVADVVTAARAGTTVYGRTTGRAPWGLQFDAGMAANVHVVTAGQCWLVQGDGAPLHLRAGDVVLLPGGAAHRLADDPGRTGVPFHRLAPRSGGEVVLDGGGPASTLLCGGYLLERGSVHPLLAALPPVVHVPAATGRGTGLAAVVDLLSAEVDPAAPGAPTVLGSLVDLLFVYVLRTWLDTHGGCCGGWARAVSDPLLGAALGLMHGDPGRAWSVPVLARDVGTSRATLHRRFTELTGQTPLAYLTAWRMALASRLLREDRMPVREVARRVGYESEFAFARAFKRQTGTPPGRFRSRPAAPELVEAW